MEQKTSGLDYEIDLLKLFKIIWREKIKIILIVLISYGIGAYYVANNKNKNARECLKKIGFSSFNAKGWVKEETLVQKRNPDEKNKYLNKLMPDEFKVFNN